MTKASDASTALAVDASPGVNGEMLKRAAEFSRELDRFGLAPNTAYNLAPALGGTIVAKPPVTSPPPQTTAFGSIPKVVL